MNGISLFVQMQVGYLYVPKPTGGRMVRKLNLQGDKVYAFDEKRGRGPGVDRDDDDKRITAYIAAHPWTARGPIEDELQLPSWRVKDALTRLNKAEAIRLSQAGNVRRWALAEEYRGME